MAPSESPGARELPFSWEWTQDVAPLGPLLSEACVSLELVVFPDTLASLISLKMSFVQQLQRDPTECPFTLL